jgi:hypothetical protein
VFNQFTDKKVVGVFVRFRAPLRKQSHGAPVAGPPAARALGVSKSLAARWCIVRT